MKVILRQPLENLGNMGEIVSVRDGYAKRKAIEHTISGDPDNPLKLEHGIDLKNLTDKDIDNLLGLITKAKVDEQSSTTTCFRPEVSSSVKA